MSWAIGYNADHKRDIGYGVPCLCEHPDCSAKIDRGLGYQCQRCELYFCGEHLGASPQFCERCAKKRKPFKPKQDTREWMRHKLTDESWEDWRRAYPDKTEKLRTVLKS